MNDQTPNPAGPNEDDPVPHQQVRQPLIGARLTDEVVDGIFATHAMVLRGQQEFVIDFIQALRPPNRLAARVILTPKVMGDFIRALRDNYEKYRRQFGGRSLEESAAPPAPQPGNASGEADTPQTPADQPTEQSPEQKADSASSDDQPPSPPNRPQQDIRSIYDELKLPDERLVGRYANVVMIGHTHAEFLIDFVTQFFPQPAVSARVFITAANVPGIIRALQTSYNRPAPPSGGNMPISEFNPPGEE